MKVYILEDENNILQYIISLVDDIPFLQLVGYSVDIQKAKKEIPELRPDLILADIQLKDGNSFELFRSTPTDAQIIFITAYDQFAIEALNIGALAYLPKPLDARAFRTAIEKCYQKTEDHRLQMQQAALAFQYLSGQQPPKKIALRSTEVIEIVKIEDILYCSGDKGYTTFYLNDGSSILVTKILKEYESILPTDVFIRCHQSYMINIAYLKKYFKEGQVEMSNGALLPVSDRKKSAILALIEKTF